MTEWTKESLDALIEDVVVVWQIGDYGYDDLAPMVSRAILASQPERVGPIQLPDDERCAVQPFGPDTRCNLFWGHEGAHDTTTRQPERVECDEENHRYFREDNGYKFCPECGQSLKGAGE